MDEAQRIQVRGQIDRHHAAYVDLMTRQHELALRLLTQQPPDFSGAATACHRAHQLALQARTLIELLGDL